MAGGSKAARGRGNGSRGGGRGQAAVVVLAPPQVGSRAGVKWLHTLPSLCA